MKRREFLYQCGGGVASLSFAHVPFAALPSTALGSVDISSSPIGFGAGALHQLPREEAVFLLYRSLDAGVNLFDASPAYGNTETEKLLGSILPKSAVVVSKTLSRTRQGALDDLHATLRRLNRDTLDVWMIHDLRTKDEWNVCHSHGGILEAAVEAKQAGKIRAFGFSTHRHPLLAAFAVQNTSIDVVMIPVSPSRFWPEAEMNSLEKELQERRVGIIGFKCTESKSQAGMPAHCALLGRQAMDKWLENRVGTVGYANNAFSPPYKVDHT